MFSSKFCEVFKNTLRLLQSINSNARSSYIQISPSCRKIQLLHHQDSEKSVKYQVLFFKQQYLSCDCQYHYCTYFPHKTSGDIQSLFVIHEVLIYQVLTFITQTSYYQLQNTTRSMDNFHYPSRELYLNCHRRRWCYEKEDIYLSFYGLWPYNVNYRYWLKSRKALWRSMTNFV